MRFHPPNLLELNKPGTKKNFKVKIYNLSLHVCKNICMYVCVCVCFKQPRRSLHAAIIASLISYVLAEADGRAINFTA